jgi:hypothetical protein
MAWYVVRVRPAQPSVLGRCPCSDRGCDNCSATGVINEHAVPPPRRRPDQGAAEKAAGVGAQSHGALGSLIRPWA